MKILIVDDDEISRILAFKILAKEGYEVLEASSAKQAIEYLESGEPIRLLISDIMMPDMDGLQLVSYINEKLSFMELPVIMYTAKRDRPTVIKAIKTGIKDYIVKPITSDALLQKVRKTLSNDIPPLADKDEILRELQIDKETYNALIDDLINTISSKIKEMRESIEQEDFERLIFTADSCRTASMSLKAKRIMDVSTKLEEVVQSKDADKSQKIVSALERELNILRDIVSKTKKPGIPKVNVTVRTSRRQTSKVPEISEVQKPFESLIKLTDREVTRILQDVDAEIIAYAIQACSRRLQKKLLNNITKRKLESVQEAIEAMPERGLRRVVENAQWNIIEIAQKRGLRRVVENAQQNIIEIAQKFDN